MISFRKETLTVADLLVRNVPDPVLKNLKRRAAEHRRSLQRELVNILEAAVREATTQDPAKVAAIIRSRLARTGRAFSDSAALIREDRSR